MPTSPCPTCGKAVAATEPDRPEWFPFCSERCKLIDLGNWFDERYRIPTPMDSPEEIQELTDGRPGDEERTERDRDSLTS